MIRETAGLGANRSGESCGSNLKSRNYWVPRISLVFREMWDTTALNS